MKKKQPIVDKVFKRIQEKIKYVKKNICLSFEQEHTLIMIADCYFGEFFIKNYGDNVVSFDKMTLEINKLYICIEKWEHLCIKMKNIEGAKFMRAMMNEHNKSVKQMTNRMVKLREEKSVKDTEDAEDTEEFYDCE